MIIPDYCVPLVGHRAWRVMANGLLSGLAIAQPWRPKRAIVAACNGHDQARTGAIDCHWVDDEWVDAPAMECVCGVYAAKAREAADAELANWRTESHATWGGMRIPAYEAFALGEVSLWGRVVDHALGYRAQYAYPKSLTIYGTQALADRVAHLYGVAVSREDVPKPKPDKDGYIWKNISSFQLTPSKVYMTAPLQSPIYYTTISSITEEEEKDQKAVKARAAAEKEKERLKALKRGWKLQPWI